MNNYLTFEEEANVERCKYILKLQDDILLSEIYDKDEINEDGVYWNSENYIKNIKKFCSKMIKNNGKLTQHYKYSNRLKTQGRKYVRGFGIQSLQHKVRGFLIGDIYNDFDIQNCAPTILKYILNLLI